MRDDRETRSWIILFGTTIGVALLMLATASVALSDLRISETEEERAFAVCERATQRWERISHVPAKLLTAISLAESGRWSAKDGRVRAWPWTVTSGGPGSYFASKAEAMNEVKRLQAAGVENIDVGCMQVNLHFHGHNFDSPAEAMDPDINAAYAAEFLTLLRDSATSWAEAAGYYHSRTPERTAYYRGKVEKFWAGLTNGKPRDDEGETRLARRTPETEPAPEVYTVTPIDRNRTAALNARFSKLKTAARKLRDDLDPALRRQKQLEAWRTARGRAEQLAHLLTVRKAELAAKRERDLENAFKTDRASRFAENRRNQLAQWRERVSSGVQPIGN
ncbi:MAG: hypothetical protein JJ900_09520 [Rhodospirillales bacterium]|nr:hypothetical protein [Rhodospirillales bacterium]MBO6787078.1 hypothetical protein [Rhodospirillales bacterium]